MISDIVHGEADLYTLKAGASLIPAGKVIKLPKVIKAIGNVGKTGFKKGKEGDKTVWKRFTQEDKPKPDKNKENQSKTGSKSGTTTSKPNQEEASKSGQAKQTKARDKRDGGTVESGSGNKFQEIFYLSDNYRLSDDTFNNHILNRHGPNSTYRNKSYFNAGFDIKEGIDSTLRGDNFVVGPNTAGREGYIFEQIFTSPIGTNSNGKPLYTLKVVIDETGNVITAFPKK